MRTPKPLPGPLPESLSELESAQALLERHSDDWQTWHRVALLLDLAHRFDESIHLLGQAVVRFQHDSEHLPYFTFHLAEQLLE